MQLIAGMNFSLKVELILTFTTAVRECWNVSEKYAWDNAEDPQQLFMDQTYSDVVLL